MGKGDFDTNYVPFEYVRRDPTGTHVLVRGLKMTPVQVPLHRVHLFSRPVTGEVLVGVSQSLPMAAISFIIGNDLAGGKM